MLKYDGFWRRHKLAKVALHKEQLSHANRKETQQRLAEDVEALKNARIVNNG